MTADKKSDIRKQFAQQFFFNPGQATDTAAEKIYELLELDPLPKALKQGAKDCRQLFWQPARERD
jgi:hypothetical protein